jgi:glycosyltransferase involved in cell wall biosynthesis
MNAASGKLVINVVVGGRFHAEQLYQALIAEGHDVRIYASSPSKYFKKVPASHVVFVPKPVQILQKLLKKRMPRVLAEWNAVAFDWAVAKFMRRCDVLWGFNGDSLIAGTRVKAEGGRYILDRACPHFYTQESLLVAESQRIGYSYEQFSDRVRHRFVEEYQIADCIVVPSEYSARSFPEQGVPAAKVQIAPLDANAPRPKDGAIVGRVDFTGVDPADFRIGLVGGSFLRKGIIYLLRATKRLGRSNVRLLIRANAANVLAHEEARRLCKELRVVFLPYLNDMNEFYRSIDAFVLPSMDEGFGMVAYEALMNGTPLLASTNVGAIDGMVPGQDFLLFSAGDEVALAEALESIYADEFRRRSIGVAGKAFYVARMGDGSQYERRVREIIRNTIALVTK